MVTNINYSVVEVHYRRWRWLGHIIKWCRAIGPFPQTIYKQCGNPAHPGGLSVVHLKIVRATRPPPSFMWFSFHGILMT